MWQKARLAWGLCFLSDPIRYELASESPIWTACHPLTCLTRYCPLTVCVSRSKEDVEKCKQKDLLEQTMSEMIGEFPALE